MDRFEAWLSPLKGREDGIFEPTNPFSKGNKLVAAAALAALASGFGMALLSRRRLLGAGVTLLAPPLIWGRQVWCKRTAEGPDLDLTTDYGKFQPLGWEELKARLEKQNIVSGDHPDAESALELRDAVEKLIDTEWEQITPMVTFERSASRNEIRQKWQSGEVVQKMDRLIELASLAAEITLFRLEALSQMEGHAIKQDTDSGRSKEEAIGQYVGQQRNPDYRAYFELSKPYHFVRSFAPFYRYEENVYPGYSGSPYGPAGEIFYDGKSPQARWRNTYNDWCSRVKPLLRHFKLDEEEIDGRYAKWATPDTQNYPGYFMDQPGTTPS